MAEIRRLQLVIAQTNVELAARQEALLDIQEEREACQQVVDVSRAEYQRLKERAKRRFPSPDQDEDDVDMSSEDCSTEDESVTGMSFIQMRAYGVADTPEGA